MSACFLRQLRNLHNAIVIGLLACVAQAASASGFTFGAIGDMPYGTDAEFVQLIGKLNAAPLAFTIHVGDIKSGSTVCSDKVFEKVRRMFDSFDMPLIYTPGDNEWTDCHRHSNGSMDPLERLAKLRSLFFPSALSLGKQSVRTRVQADEEGYREFVENRMWSRDGVTFATLHIVGSNNNHRSGMSAEDEFYRRDAANLHWMAQVFAQAKARDDAAVVLAMQADTSYPVKPGKPSGFQSWLDAFAQHAQKWGRPVLLIQGDSHSYRVDHGFRDGGMGPLPNVMRLVVPGAGHVAAVLVTVDTASQTAPFKFSIIEPDPIGRY